VNKRYLTVIVVGISVILLYQLSSSVTLSLSSITANLKSEDELSVSLNMIASTVSGNHKMLKADKQKGSTHSESITAQQIERFLSYNQQNKTILQNIYDNLDYYKNPTAALFYLSFAYKQLGDYEKSLQFLQEIEELANTNYTYLYLFNSKRLENHLYFVPIKAEILLRKAELNYMQNKKTIAAENLNKLLTMADSSYGYGDIVFLYSELAAKNIRNMKQDKQFISSRDKYYSAANARHLVKVIMKSSSKEIIANYISKEYSSLILGTVYTDKNKFIDDYEQLSLEFSKIPSQDISIDLINYGIRGGYDLYHFQAAGYHFEILNKENDQYLLRLKG